MSCCQKRSKRAEKRLQKGNKHKKNSVVPETNYDYKNSKVDQEFIDHMIKDVLLCEGCNTAFTLRSGEIKIHCNGCDQFFHCKIAGECQGKDCCLKLADGSIHRASYCFNCSKINYQNNQCLCKDCYKDS
jgi:hypothetical protein